MKMFKNILTPILLQIRHVKWHSSIVYTPFVFPYRIRSPSAEIDTALKENYSQFNTRGQLKSNESFSVKNSLIKEMNFQCQEDAAPFYELPTQSLKKICRVTKKDDENGFCKNRLYYIAEHINCEPCILSKLIVRRLFIYELTFDWLENSLKTLLEMGVSGERITKDLWVLKYNHETIKQRLQKVKDSGCDQVYPWMVRCSNVILERNIKLTQDAKDILGDNTMQEYLAHRLDTTTKVIETMCHREISLRSIRVTKLKSFLDFLFCEGFTKEDIIRKPHVLASSQKTIKHRLNMLRSLGIEPINLNILCRGRKGFQKYYDTIVKFKHIE